MIPPVVASSADTVLFAISSLVGVAGALGVAYTVFRSASEQRLRDVDQHIINNQNLLMQQLESELSKLRTDVVSAEQKATTYRESLTQRAAVDHLAEIVVQEEKTRRAEHEAQMVLIRTAMERIDSIVMLMKEDVIAQLRGMRGTIG